MLRRKLGDWLPLAPAVTHAGHWDAFDLETSAVGRVSESDDGDGLDRLRRATVTADGFEFGADFGGEDVAERGYPDAAIG